MVRITIKKHMGDDSLSWAVFIDGRPKWTGLSRAEARYYRDLEKRKTKVPTTCPDCKAENQGNQFCGFCQQHFGPNTNRPLPARPCCICGQPSYEHMDADHSYDPVRDEDSYDQ